MTTLKRSVAEATSVEAHEVYSLILSEGEPAGYAYAIILDGLGEEIDRLFVEPPPPLKDRCHDEDIWWGDHPESDLLGFSSDQFSPTAMPGAGFYNNVDDMWGCPDYPTAIAALFLEHAIRVDQDWYFENSEAYWS
jgi:hypothetical protein